jgi:hypothetical protein
VKALYQHIEMDPSNTPKSLQNKVQFDLRFFLCRRGNENVYEMTKTTFEVTTDPYTGLKYVYKAQDELDKNHGADSTDIVSGVMQEMKGSPSCPVSSFLKYIEALHPDCPYLWQRPKSTAECRSADEKGNDLNCYYYNQCVSENTLGAFMNRMSHLCDLSCVYTNHCIRVTGTTFLHRQNFSAKQVMSVTGHKSVNTLALYERVNDNEKLLVGTAMNCYLTSSPQDLQLEYTENPEEMPKRQEPPVVSQHPPIAPKRKSNTLPLPKPAKKKCSYLLQNQT